LVSGKISKYGKRNTSETCSRIKSFSNPSMLTENDVPKVKVAHIDGNMSVEEMETLKFIFPSAFIHSLFKMFKFLSDNDRETAFSEFFIALRIVLTIPVSFTSRERSFSF
jgi:hypothetical protein